MTQSDEGPDYAITAMTNDGAFRVMVARTTHTVTDSLSAQKVPTKNRQHYANMMTSTALLRLTMAPGLRVQGLLRGASGKGTLVAESFPDGACRGLLHHSDAFEVGEHSLMQFMRTMPNGAIQQGSIELGPNHQVLEGLTTYLQDSEQIVSVAGLASVFSEEHLIHSGGFLVQLLPECTEPPLALMYERARNELADLGRLLIETNNKPEAVLDAILYLMPYTITQQYDLFFRCQCSEERVLAGLATLSQADIDDILQKGETLEIQCDYCNKQYFVAPERLRSLNAQS